MVAITSFSGSNAYLSNFYYAPCVYEGVLYPTSEHAYQAAKFPAGNYREAIRVLPTPGKTKTFARAHTYAQSKDFHERKLTVMLDCLRAKFLLNKDLSARLLATVNPPVDLVEGNTWGDRYWGVCDGEGENHLGKLLMRVREGLFLYQMAGIYPGDPDGSLSKEACKLLGLEYTPVEVTVTYDCEPCQNTGRQKDGSRCQECGGSGRIAA